MSNQKRIYKAEKALQTAINRIVRREPFWAKLLACLKITVTPGNEIVTNGIQIELGEEVIYENTEEHGNRLTTDLLESIVLGMVLKIGLLHQQRRKNRSQSIWNAACNMHVVNLLNEMNYEVPPEVKKACEELNITDVLEEKIYEKLLEELAKQPINQSKADTTEENQNSAENNVGKGKKSNNNNSSEESDNSEEQSNSNNDDDDDDSNNDNSSEENDTSKNSHSKNKKQGKSQSKKDSSDENEEDDSSNESEEDNSNKVEKAMKKLNEKMGTLKKQDKSSSEAEDAEDRQIELTINQILIAGQQAGDIPEFFKQKIKSLRKTNFSLHRILEEFVVSSIEPSRYNWQKPNRRYMEQKIYYPTIYNENVGGVIVAFDTSGSCWNEIQKVLGVVLELNELYCGSGEPINLLYCDTKVHHQLWNKKGDLPEPVGGGGTSYAPVMKWVKEKVSENPEQFTNLLYITDGECNDFGINPGIPVTWLVLNLYRLSKAELKKFPYGRTVVVSREELETITK